MTNYKQLGQEQRYVIDRLLRQGKSKSEIARVLGKLFDQIGFNAIPDKVFRKIVLARLGYPLNKLKKNGGLSA